MSNPLKERQKLFKKVVRGYDEKRTVCEMLGELEKETGLNMKDVALWMGCDSSTVSKMAKDDKLRTRIKSVCRDLTLMWKFEERVIFDFDE